MATKTIIGYTTWGSVRGLGPIRPVDNSLAEAQQLAERDLRDDQDGCRKQRGYSDRDVYAIDEEGYVVDADGDNVWPHGRTHRALRVRVRRTWHVSIKTAPHQGWTFPQGWGPYETRSEAEDALVKADKLWMSVRIVESTVCEVRS